MMGEELVLKRRVGVVIVVAEIFPYSTIWPRCLDLCFFQETSLWSVSGHVLLIVVE